MLLESVGATAGEASAKSLESMSAWMVVECEGEFGKNEGTDGLPILTFFLLGEAIFDFEFCHLIDHPLYLTFMLENSNIYAFILS